MSTPLHVNKALSKAEAVKDRRSYAAMCKSIREAVLAQNAAMPSAIFNVRLLPSLVCDAGEPPCKRRCKAGELRCYRHGGRSTGPKTAEGKAASKAGQTRYYAKRKDEGKKNAK